VLVIGAANLIPDAVTQAWGEAARLVVGPRASEHGAAHVAIDTGIAGIHHAGTALRMDDVPLRLRQVIDGPANPLDMLRRLMRVTKSGAAEGPPLPMRTAQESTR
jgi:formylmethanofuran dehydrogenase subunit B